MNISDSNEDDGAELQSSDTATMQSYEDVRPAPKFQTSQKVWARDQDGLLYTAWIRRSLYGVHHNRQMQVGFNSTQEMEQVEQEEPDEDWHYFCHFEGWKPNWDRWVAETDILELTPEHTELAQRLLAAHRALQQECKAKSKRSKVTDGGAFLKLWKVRLTSLLAATRESNNDTAKESSRTKKSSQKLRQAALEKQAKLSVKHLAHRKPVHAQQLFLDFQLKRILVEEWEVLSQFDMVHKLPSKVTVKEALQRYIANKGVTVKDVIKDTGLSAYSSSMEEVPSATTSGNTNEELQATDAAATTATSPDMMEHDNIVDEETTRRHKEWIDMANGLCQLFDEALPVRLLYPSEQTQLTVMEQLQEQDDRPKSGIYGCEHLLRLFCKLPELLHEQRTEHDDVEGEEEVKTILAKVNDLCRFLQKNHDSFFSQSYRKKNEEELKYELKVQKRLDRKRKQMVLEQNEEVGSVDGAASSIVEEPVAA